MSVDGGLTAWLIDRRAVVTDAVYCWKRAGRHFWKAPPPPPKRRPLSGAPLDAGEGAPPTLGVTVAVVPPRSPMRMPELCRQLCTAACSASVRGAGVGVEAQQRRGEEEVVGELGTRRPELREVGGHVAVLGEQRSCVAGVRAVEGDRGPTTPAAVGAVGEEATAAVVRGTVVRGAVAGRRRGGHPRDEDVGTDGRQRLQDSGLGLAQP